MDVISSVVKRAEVELEAPTQQKQPGKKSPFRNGVLKIHAPPYLHHPVVISYKECLKNHAAALGGHAVDGCGEFMPSPAANLADPTSLKCAACGCHRNFHRREHDDGFHPPDGTPALEYKPNSRHHPPISSSYYNPSAPHMLMALAHKHGVPGLVPDGGTPLSAAATNVGSATGGIIASGPRKRFRTKFSQDQKEKMLEFAEKV